LADDPAWVPPCFCKNLDRPLDSDIAAKFFAGVLNLPKVKLRPARTSRLTAR
jgi:hypothetical protein